MSICLSNSPFTFFSQIRYVRFCWLFAWLTLFVWYYLWYHGSDLHKIFALQKLKIYVGRKLGKILIWKFRQKVFIFFKNLHHCFLLRLIKNYFRYCIRFSSENFVFQNSCNQAMAQGEKWHFQFGWVCSGLPRHS